MFQSSFFKNIALLSFAGLLGKLAAFAALPILSRMYEPEAFGLYSIYFALLTAFPLIASLRLDFAVTVSREKNTARLLAMGAFFSLLIFSFLTVFLLSALIHFEVLPFKMGVLPFLCASIFFVGACDVLRYWGVRHDQHSAYGISQLVQSISLVVGQLLFFAAGAHLSGLVMGDSISRFAMFAFLFAAFGKDIISNIKWLSFWRVIKAYILRFITYTATNLLHVTPNIVLPIFITSVYSEQENGYYLFGYQVIFSITGIFISSISQVFLGKIAHQQKDPIQLMQNVNKVVMVLALLGLPCLIALMFYGPALYSFIFGDKWERAGMFAQVLAPAIYTQLVLAPVLSVFIILKQPAKQLVIDFVWAFLTILCLYVCWKMGLDSITMLSCFSALTVVMFSLFYIRILFMLQNSKDKLLEVM